MALVASCWLGEFPLLPLVGWMAPVDSCRMVECPQLPHAGRLNGLCYLL
jgi:hypothetical protein